MKPCLKRPTGTRSSKKPSDPRVYRGTVDAKRRKRVEFVERDAFHATSDPRDASSPSANRASSRDDPKTSEYRSFKKLLVEAGRGSRFHKAVRRGNALSSTHTGDPKNKQNCNKEATGSALPAEKVMPLNQVPPLLPTGDLDGKGHISFVESQYTNGGTFYEKRQNLVKYAASVFSLEVNELISKGYDLIPVFLRRLGISKKASKFDELSKMNVMDSSFRPKSLAFPRMQICQEKPFEILETEHRMTVVSKNGNNLPAGWWNKDEEIFPSTEHMEAQCFPIWNIKKSDFPKNWQHSYLLSDTPDALSKNISDPDFNPSAELAISRHKQLMLDSKISTSSRVNDEQLSPFWGSYEEQSVLSHSNLHFLEFDIPQTPSKPERLPGQYSSLPLLGWNEEINNEGLLVASDNTEMKGTDQLPLSLYRVPHSQHPAGDAGILDSFPENNLFHSFGDIRILKDMTYPCPKHVLLPSRSNFAMGSECEDLSTYFCRDIFSSFSPNCPCSYVSNNSTFQGYLIGSSETEPRSHFSCMACDFWDISSFGFGISPRKEENGLFTSSW